MANQTNSLTSVFNAGCFLLIVASSSSSSMLSKLTISGVGYVDSRGVFLPPGFRARRSIRHKSNEGMLEHTSDEKMIQIFGGKIQSWFELCLEFVWLAFT